MENTEEKVSWILKWFGKYGRKDRKDMKNTAENSEKILKIWKVSWRVERFGK